MKLSVENFRYGIEHEFPSIDKTGNFVDFSNTSFADLDRVISVLPEYESDYQTLRVGDLGIKKKRWYIEGFERFDDNGTYLRTDVKGFEIRTPICDSIPEAVQTLQESFSLWRTTARSFGYTSATVSFNPFKTGFVPEPPLNEWEINDRQSPEEKTAFMHMLTYGPDVNFSHPDMTPEQGIAIAKKLTYYAPFIVPFSFSAPFYDGKLWDGLSYRTFYRNGNRPACMVFMENKQDLLKTTSTLTDLARVPSEVGRIEFKAFDTVQDVTLYGAFLALIIGISLDETLAGEALVPDSEMLKKSARFGFKNDEIYAGAQKVFIAADNALPPNLRVLLEPLRSMLNLQQSPASSMIDLYSQGKDIISIIKHTYE